MPRLVIKKTRRPAEPAATAAPAARPAARDVSPVLRSCDEAADFLGVSKRTLRSLSRPNGPLLRIRPVPGRVFYDQADLDSFVAERRAAALAVPR